jgi:hypothetical protein
VTRRQRSSYDLNPDYLWPGGRFVENRFPVWP